MKQRALIVIAFLTALLLASQANAAECGNIQCEAGETRECAIDCGSALSHRNFSDMMGLFEITYYTPSEGAEHFPGVAFFIGDPSIQYSSLYSSGLDKYCYVSATNNHNSEKWSKNTAINRSTFVELTEADIDKIFEDYGVDRTYCNPDGTGCTNVTEVVVGKLERLDIEKFCTENYPAETCNEIKFGVQTDSSLNLIVDAKNNPIADSQDVNYQNGKTIVYPIPYAAGKGRESRPFYNFNNPVVREYAIRLVLKAQEKCETNFIFMDNFIPRDELFYNETTDQKLFYVSSIPATSSGSTEHTRKQSEVHILHLLEILKEVKARNSNTKFILNGYTPHLVSRNTFIDIATSNEHKNSFEMIMVENRFNEDLSNWITGEYGFPGYYPQIKKLYDAEKSALFTAGDVYYLSTPADSTNYKAYKIWLWAHLVGNDKSYIYINHNYTKPMINYTTYSYKLGQPQEEPHKDGNTWYRKFDRGTIVFDTTSKTLDPIKFIEDTSQACGNGICDSDIGETTEACPADCAPAQECVDNEKLVGDYIPKWKRGEISMLTLMQIMKQWRTGAGCPPAA